MLMLRTKMTRATMIYAIIVLVALSALASAGEKVEKNTDVENDDNGKSTKRNLYSLDGFKFNMKEQLGHFKRLPFTNLYRNYMLAVKSDTMDAEKIAQDSNAWYRPDYSTCYGFLSEKNRVKNDFIYLKNLLDFIVADACAAYVVKKVYEEDGVSEAEKENIEQYTKACQTFYDSRIDHFNQGKRSCIANLLAAKVHSRANHKTEECHHSLIQAFIQFAECSNYYMLTNRFDDVYVKLIYDLVRSETKVCFLKQLELINDMIRADFGDSWLIYFTEGKRLNGLKKSVFSPEQQQQINRLWDLGLTRVLKAVENTKQPINLREVNRILSHQQNGDGLLERRFLENVAAFATEHIKIRVISEVEKKKGPKTGRFQLKKKEFNEALNDQFGADRYRKFVDKMCSRFRVNLDGRGPEYVKPLIRLVKLIDFPFTFNIDETTFVKTVLTDERETAPVYLAVIACHFLGLTEGTIRNSKGKPHYQVAWLNNADAKRIVWPLARYV